jgi:hypothetical protein|tara:strand:+ start:238 stop:732 length:495 start_codon:yes stop_codon:yes gene_type:complete
MTARKPRAKKNTITTTVRELRELYPAFQTLVNKVAFRGKMLYQITKLFGKVESEIKAYDKVNTEIIKRLGELVNVDQLLGDAEIEAGRELSEREEDNIRRQSKEAWKVTTENDEKYTEENEAILDQEVELTGVLRISWTDIQALPKAISIEPALLAPLEPLMEE